ncbi:MAG: hypothetical protein CVV25_03570 [Ignavibacteriae bacterium HGW-Ignavibacteriae-4]|jgi:hypothetical protein|nr:MAG: hypothetical protein CVV25_03570 [Ignavibacteriae bacterium HGW-Ignavibacteriae-4]
MKNLLLVLLIVLPTALFSASPSCVAGTEVSLIDANGKVFKTGKFDNRGQLTLDGLDDVAYTIRLTKNGQSCDLDKPTEGRSSGLPTGKRMHKPITFRMSSQNGSAGIFRPSSGTWATSNKTSPRDAASGLATGKRQHKPMNASTDEGEDNDCDDFEISVTVTGGGGGAGKAVFQEMTVTR